MKSSPLKNLKHERFCNLFAGTGDRTFMSNGTLSYIEAFNIDTGTSRELKKWKPKEKAFWDYPKKYKSARTQAYLLLTNQDIKVRIHHLFQERFNPEHVDNELLSVIDQNEDRNAKVAGIREFNALKGRITKRIKLSGELKSTLSDERLGKVAEHVLKRSKAKAK